MNRIITYFRSRMFLHDMLTRYVNDNEALQHDNDQLRHKLGEKDKVLQKAIDDHAQSIKFHQTVITNMQKRIDELLNQHEADQQFAAEMEEKAVDYRGKYERLNAHVISCGIDPNFGRVEFTTSDNIKVFAELTQSDETFIIDIIGSGPGSERDFIAAVEYTRPNPLCPDDGNAIRVVAFNGNDEDGEPAALIDFDTHFLLHGPDEDYDALEAQKG